MEDLYKLRVIDNQKVALKDTINHFISRDNVNTLNIAVGYFYISGLLLIKDEFKEFMDKKYGKVQIIMGNETNKETSFVLSQSVPDKKYFENLSLDIQNDITKVNDINFLKSVNKWIQEGRISIKIYTGKANYFHAKTYLFSHSSNKNEGRAVTGSSNFSKSGLLGNTELNVFSQDNFYALKNWFDALWISDEVSSFSPELLNIISNVYPKINDHNNYFTVQETYFDFANLYASPIFVLDNNKEWISELYAHQKSGIIDIDNKLSVFGTAILADGVGLGKTRTAAGIVKLRLEKNPNTKILIIADRKLHTQWEEELAIVGISDNTVNLINREVFAKLDRSQLDNYCEKYSFIIIDEVHQGFKNRKTKSFKKAMYLKENGKEELEALLLTATPWNNSRQDVLNIGSLFLNIQNIPNNRIYKQYFSYGNNGKIIRQLEQDDQAFDEFWEDLFLQRTRKTIGSENELFADRKFLTADIPFEPQKNQIFSDNFDRLADLKFPYMDPIKYFNSSRYNVGGEQTQLILLKQADSSWVSYVKSLDNIISNLRKMKDIFEKNKSRDAQSFIKEYLGKHYEIDEYSINEVENSIFNETDITSLFDFERDSLTSKEIYLNRIMDQIDSITPNKAKNAISTIMAHLNSDLTNLGTLLESTIHAYKSRDEKYDTIKSLICEELSKNKKVILISQFKTTVEYYFDNLCKEDNFDKNNIGLVTGGSQANKIGHNHYTKNQILNRFSPRAKNKKEFIDTNEEIDLLIGTETISTGQNLQDSIVLMNLDLPYNPMTLEQRIGRIDRPRPKEITDNIYIYTFPNYEAIESELKMTERLSKKMEGVLQDTQFDSLILPEYQNYLKNVKNEKGAAVEKMVDETVEKTIYKGSPQSDSHSEQYKVSNKRLDTFRQNKLFRTKDPLFDKISFTNGESDSVVAIKISYKDVNKADLYSETRTINLSTKKFEVFSNAENNLYNELKNGINTTDLLSEEAAKEKIKKMYEILEHLVKQEVDNYNSKIAQIASGIGKIENKKAKKASLKIKESVNNPANKITIKNKMKEANFKPKNLGKLTKDIELIDDSSPLYGYIKEIANDVDNFWLNFEEYIDVFSEFSEEFKKNDKINIDNRIADKNNTTFNILLANIVF